MCRHSVSIVFFRSAGVELSINAHRHGGRESNNSFFDFSRRISSGVRTFPHASSCTVRFRPSISVRFSVFDFRRSLSDADRYLAIDSDASPGGKTGPDPIRVSSAQVRTLYGKIAVR